MKPKLGIFAFGGCMGCQHALLNDEDIMLELLEQFDIQHFPLISEHTNDKGQFDIALIEGAINTRQALKKLKEIRKNSRILIAIGTCAVFGGIPSLKNFLNSGEVELVYGSSYSTAESIAPSPADHHVRVDFAVKGCPVDTEDIISIMKKFLVGKKPVAYDKPVCIECRANENPCLLQLGKDCLGPLTCGGCNAVCVNSGIACFGCRGPVEKPELKAAVELLSKKGYSREEIMKKLQLFAGLSRRWKE